MLKAKILFVGPCESGKTVLANFLTESSDIAEYNPTQGVRIVEFEDPQLASNSKGAGCEFELWDCGGDTNAVLEQAEAGALESRGGPGRDPGGVHQVPEDHHQLGVREQGPRGAVHHHLTAAAAAPPSEDVPSATEFRSPGPGETERPPPPHPTPTPCNFCQIQVVGLRSGGGAWAADTGLRAVLDPGSLSESPVVGEHPRQRAPGTDVAHPGQT
ncbi:intraflagellar transport protein 22 homolog isoform X1 [Oryctolagus cuniculus]|uniref:intraflagellar transport protein 22 homolog isoform X1 n=1 Tax=Oryctolagus cuniculus TaxID=9986 RepID=UPI003879E65C